MLIRVLAAVVAALLLILCIGAWPARAANSAVIHGLTLSGLQNNLPVASAISPNTAMSVSAMSQIKAQIRAAKMSWHANAVRLQVMQDKLVGASGTDYSPAYMGNISAAVNYAENIGLYVIINCQTEPGPGFTENEPRPTYATRAFWSRIGKSYGNDPRVIFDLFNEPRLSTWDQWQRDMQGVTDSVRGQGWRNTVWVEGIHHADSLAGAGAHLLHGGRIVYTIHHPAGAPSRRNWNADFGNLASRGVPVEVGEWTNFANGYHWADAPASVPAFLSYLGRRHIGMTVWTMLPGVLNSTGNFSSVTTMNSHWPQPGQGAGQLVRDWFGKR